jgi:hypothetical protein
MFQRATIEDVSQWANVIAHCWATVSAPFHSFISLLIPIGRIWFEPLNIENFLIHRVQFVPGYETSHLAKIHS